MPYTEGILTFTAGAAINARRVVKFSSGTVTTPPQVEQCGAGEFGIGVSEYAAASGELVAVKLWQAPGSFEIECLVDTAINRGTTLYVGANGVATDASSGTSIGISNEVAADYQHIEVIPNGNISTTAATVSVADAGNIIIGTTVEAALAEAFTHVQSIQNFIPIPLTSWMIGDGTNTVSFGGPATDPILDMTNGDTDSCLRWAWAATSVEEIITQVPLPPHLDTTKDLVIHLWCGKDANADTVTLDADCYFNFGDTKVSDVTATIAQTPAETIITIAAADVPAGAQTLTIELTPSAHANDALYLFATWLEYAGKTLTS